MEDPETLRALAEDEERLLEEEQGGGGGDVPPSVFSVASSSAEQTGGRPRDEELSHNHTRGSFLNLSQWSNKYLLLLLATAVTSVITSAVFIGLYVNERISPRGGEAIPTPVILKLSSEELKSEVEGDFERMFISGYNDTFPSGMKEPPGIVRWRKSTNQDNFWYLETLPLTSTVIYNDLDSGATIHFHGLTPPSNQDGVPFVANANINPQNMQRYRFNQFTYPGMHWMHAHTGFKQAFGVSAPIILQHNDFYAKSNGFSKDDDLVVMLEDGNKYPECAYANGTWFNETTECGGLQNGVLFLINRQEKAIEHKPTTSNEEGAPETIRIRFLNGGTLVNWKITTLSWNTATLSPVFNKKVDPSMEILATDGQDVIRKGVKKESDFVLGLANRIDVLLTVDPKRDVLIAGIQMPPFGQNTTNPAVRYIVIRGKDTPEHEKINVDELNKKLFFKGTCNQTTSTNFGIYANLASAHPLPERKVNRTYSLWNRGGNREGGFPLEIFEGIVDSKDAEPLRGHYDNYTQYNNLKFQLPPYKVYRHKTDKNRFISTTRKCAGCNEDAMDGRRERPTAFPYNVTFDDVKHSNSTCCWEWCDVSEDQCKDFELEDVKYFEANKNYIPVCYGDRVQIVIINTAQEEGHPMHLHGHDFVLTHLYDGLPVPVQNKDHRHKTDGPKLDTIFVSFNKSVAIDFDAYNPGEHLIHCHIDDHLTGGMLVTVRYMHDDECQDLPEFVGGNVGSYTTQFCTASGDCKELNEAKEF